MSSPRFCVFIDTVLKGKVPAIYDEKGQPCLFETLEGAQREVADNLVLRLQQFLAGQRDYDDAMTVEEYIEEVDQLSDGSFTDAFGNIFDR